jgi:hypothetical protein
VKKLFKSMSKQNINEVRQELSRAHLVIVLLSIIAIVLLLLSAIPTAEFDTRLSNTAGVLLGVIMTISLVMSLILYDINNKK